MSVVLPSIVDPSPREIPGLATVGPLAFGCWRFVGTDVAPARSLVETALDIGMNLIDTADIYGRGHGGGGFGESEELLGKVLREAPHLRDQMVIATKGGIREGVPYDSSGQYLVAAAEASLRRMRLDVIDLYQVHRPDLLAHPAEVGQALDSLVSAGKVRAVGVSNHTVAQTTALAGHMHTPIVSLQPELSAARLGPLRDGTGDLAMRNRLAVLAWSPLAGGRLGGAPTGRGLGDEVVENQELLNVIDDLAAREEVGRASIALAFVLALPFRPIAILGTQNEQRLRTALRALTVRLDRRDCYRIIEASEGVPLP